MRISIKGRLRASAVVALLLACSAVLLRCTEPVQAPDDLDVYAVIVGNFTAKNQGNGSILLTWQAPDNGRPDYYKITRYTMVEQKRTDTSEALIPGASTSYVNWLSLVRVEYLYSIVPVKEVNGTRIYGRAVEQTVLGGSGISFAVNRGGAATTATRECVLSLMDESLLLDSVRLTQKIKVDSTPDFDQNDTANGERIFKVGASVETTVPWKLEPGAGKKIVYAAIRFKGSPNRDTLSAEMPVTGYQVLIRIENRRMTISGKTQYGPPDATVIYESVKAGAFETQDKYYFNRPKVEFSVSIYGDSTMAEEFEYWLAFPNAQSNLEDYDSTSSDQDKFWWETVPRKAKLTDGGGAFHDERKVYQYNLDTTDSEGRENLNSLVRVRYTKFGSDGRVVYPDLPAGVRNAPASVGKPGENYKRLVYLRRGDLMIGVKQFRLVLRFKGKQFGDVRYTELNRIVLGRGSGGNLEQTRRALTYLDFYPPFATFVDRSDLDYINNGDTVAGPFSVVLNKSERGQSNASAKDNGRARVTGVSLVIAQCPDTLVWDFWNWGSGIVPPATLSDLMSWTHLIIPFHIRVYERDLLNVRWDDIDPGQWRAGRYLVGIVTRDEWGNEGLAPVAMGNGRSNPFIITVLSGK